MVGGSIRKFVYDADGPAFLKRELVGLGFYVNLRNILCKKYFLYRCFNFFQTEV